MQEFKDYMSEADLLEAWKDPRWKPFLAGFNKAEEIYSKPSELVRVTSAIDHFLWWKEHEDIANPRQPPKS